MENIILANIPLLLEGPTGVGKTWQVRELADKYKKNLHVINVSGELTVDSILGQQTLVEGTIKWCDGVLTRAMRQGDWVLFDELNTALPEVLTIINGVLDDMRAVTLPNADNERVEAHEDFRFIGTQNPAGGNYAGTARLNDALLNRMVRIEVGYMSTYDEVEALKKHTTLKDNTLAGLVEVARYTRTKMDEPLSTRDLVKVVRLQSKGKLSIKDAMQLVLGTKYARDEMREICRHYERIVGELREITDYNNDDPIEYLKQEKAKLEVERAELRKEKETLKETAYKELVVKLLQKDI